MLYFKDSAHETNRSESYAHAQDLNQKNANALNVPVIS